MLAKHLENKHMRLLDLFCGAGGCAVGYHRAGFTEIVGVDIKPQPRYPFEFVQGDALEYVVKHGKEFDAIHASPPCQQHSQLKHLRKKEYECYIAPLRDVFMAIGKPWVMENVIGAPLQSAVTLCGSMFRLRVYRHRLFETSFFCWEPAHPPHKVPAQGSRSKDARFPGMTRKQRYEAGANATVVGHCGVYVGPAMGIDWMRMEELSQAIPPAYTEFIGRQLLAAIRHSRESA